MTKGHLEVGGIRFMTFTKTKLQQHSRQAANLLCRKVVEGVDMAQAI
jgi:hypothetical protein